MIRFVVTPIVGLIRAKIPVLVTPYKLPSIGLYDQSLTFTAGLRATPKLLVCSRYPLVGLTNFIKVAELGLKSIV